LQTRPSPIEAHLSDLVSHQDATRRQSDLEAWLTGLDVGSEEIVRITTKDGVKAKALWELFRQETDSRISLTKFGLEMARHANDPKLPFGPKVPMMDGTFYPLKPGKPSRS
jgi:hypothetical protein